MLWYAGERGLPGGLGRESDGAERHEDGPVPVHHRRRRPAAAGAGGAPALPVGGALPQGQSHRVPRARYAPASLVAKNDGVNLHVNLPDLLKKMSRESLSLNFLSDLEQLELKNKKSTFQVFFDSEFISDIFQS